MAGEVARVLLPRVTEYGEVRGVPGGRAVVENDQVLLRRIGLRGSVTLTGVSARYWQAAVGIADQVETQCGRNVCHRDSPHRWTAAELACTPRRPTHSTALICSAWLASALLRRVGLLRTLGTPLNTTAWTRLARDETTWIVEHEYLPAADGADNHHRCLDLLTDPQWGLPPTETRWDCRCRTLQLEDFGSTCSVHARCQGRPGRLKFRFTRRGTWTADQYRQQHGGLNAREALYVPLPDRVLPPGGPAKARPALR